jgi:hypothetical protein
MRRMNPHGSASLIADSTIHLHTAPAGIAALFYEAEPAKKTIRSGATLLFNFLHSPILYAGQIPVDATGGSEEQLAKN